MQIGLLTDSLSTMTRAQALDTAAELGVDTVEIGLGGAHGGWSPAPHADLADLLTDPAPDRRCATTSPPAACGWRPSTPPATRCTRSPATVTTTSCAAHSSSPRSSRSTPW